MFFVLRNWKLESVKGLMCSEVAPLLCVYGDRLSLMLVVGKVARFLGVVGESW
jgi:hypothetical protein